MKFDTHVMDIIKPAYDVKSFRFPRPVSFDYKPGQFMYIALKSGKKVMMKHFTISSSPTEDCLEFTKKLTGQDFSNALDALEIGDSVEINGPFGFFTFEGELEKVGMLTGGIGITPIRSMCRFCTDEEKVADIVLLYGNRCEKDIAFFKEFKEMPKQNKNLRIVFTLSEPDEGWTGRSGRINMEIVKEEIPDYMERIFFVCGPPRMVEALDNMLKELGLPQSQINKEDFPGYEKVQVYDH